MLFSVIIVNYNVKYFLEQCLCSVEKSLRTAGLRLGGGTSMGGQSAGFPDPAVNGIGQAEIFVVDNASSDGSLDWLIPRHPAVTFIANPDNRGFAKANNQALARATGEYILFLNPDTILAEDCLAVVLAFMRSTPAAGAAGVRMVDGGGRFLKESRRGFPTPWVAFCKLTGLAALFPHSSSFAGYYLGHLPASADHPAPILSGAFMLVRKVALDRTGGFDEQFFLYAEDIDLSYRIEAAGYTNYYIAGVTILHFKGESTRKDSRYIKLFYKAMSQFRRKHFKGMGSSAFSVLMETAIWLRAGVAATGNLFRRRDDGTGDPDGEIRRSGSGLDGTSDAGRGQARAVWIGGDPVNAGQLKDLLAADGRTIGPDPSLAEEMIFCEGEHFSFKTIIEAIENGPGKAVYKIHAGGSSSAVGSRSKDGRGETLFFPPKA